jgi:CBS domain-containing protein
MGSERDEPGGMATISRSRKGDQRGVPADPVITTLMTSRVVAVSPGMALIEALRVMDSAGVRHLPVVEGTRCVGLLTEVDVLRQLVTHALVQPESTARLTAAEVCRRPAPVVPVWATRATAAHVMLALGIDAVIVLEDDHIHGIVTTSDLAASLVKRGSAVSASAAEQHPPETEDPPEIGT